MRMMLMTKELRTAFEKQGDTSQKKAKDIKVICKFFDPCGRWTFYVYDFDGKDYLFGYCISALDETCDEFSSASLQEITQTRNRLGLYMERDKGFAIGSRTVQEVLDKYGK